MDTFEQPQAKLLYLIAELASRGEISEKDKSSMKELVIREDSRMLDACAMYQQDGDMAALKSKMLSFVRPIHLSVQIPTNSPSSSGPDSPVSSPLGAALMARKRNAGTRLRGMLVPQTFTPQAKNSHENDDNDDHDDEEDGEDDNELVYENEEPEEVSNQDDSESSNSYRSLDPFPMELRVKTQLVQPTASSISSPLGNALLNKKRDYQHHHAARKILTNDNVSSLEEPSVEEDVDGGGATKPLPIHVQRLRNHGRDQPGTTSPLDSALLTRKRQSQE
eukprot:GILK01007501.1.p1 GENE.GILK01007501.1~~GILK01007501.1.p1  ORF type:complete len:290 (-),score=43.52 GILK01007501.1:191-1024(-)